ncbi:GLPGLI family protein [Flavicella sediminum]|uniref:GLPGLI family protein n=1 Tax=Flavicella sediminum TaxID=2585141 RepID=UPI0011222CD2|nr:GLPGLI family protein [Flavicella sediminum]
MKKIVIIILFFAFNIANSQGLTGKITYQATSNSAINRECIKTDRLMSEREKKMQLNLISKSVAENFHLIFDGNISVFKAEYDMPTRRRLGLVMNYTGFLAHSQYIYLSKIGSNHVLGQSFFKDRVVIAYEPISWQLTQETKLIGEYICYKAIALIKNEQAHYSDNYIKPIVAWYTPEIPVHYGIRNFRGLPGLTLELTINTGKGEVLYKATKIELNPSEEIKIKKLKGKTISEDAYIKMIQKMNSQRRNK